MAIKENTDQNALHVACTVGSFHVILDMFISILNAMKYFTNKNTCLYEIALEIVCDVIGCPVVYGVSFERCSVPYCLTLASVISLRQPLISAQL